jgi:hypothetical protein
MTRLIQPPIIVMITILLSRERRPFWIFPASKGEKRALKSKINTHINIINSIAMSGKKILEYIPILRPT